jgi:hypothetical protein
MRRPATPGGGKPRAAHRVVLRNCCHLALFPPNLNRTIALSFSGNVLCAPFPSLSSPLPAS